MAAAETVAAGSAAVARPFMYIYTYIRRGSASLASVRREPQAPLHVHLHIYPNSQRTPRIRELVTNERHKKTGLHASDFIEKLICRITYVDHSRPYELRASGVPCGFGRSVRLFRAFFFPRRGSSN